MEEKYCPNTPQSWGENSATQVYFYQFILEAITPSFIGWLTLVLPCFWVINNALMRHFFLVHKAQISLLDASYSNP